MQFRTGFPRVQIPGVDRAEVKSLTEELTAAETLRLNYSRAMHALGKHVYANTVTCKDKAARRKTDTAARAARKVHR